MEVSGAVLRRIPCLPGAATDSGHSSRLRTVSASFGNMRMVGFRSRKAYGFEDKGHLSYYYEPTRCGGKKEKVKVMEMEKEKEKEKTAMKKKAKLLKGLSKNLTMFSSIGFGLDPEAGLVGEVQSKTISEATEILLKQLEQLKAEEKELKKKRREEKAKAKAMKEKMRTGMDCESSSTSSESSDSDCGGEVVDMSCLRNKAEPVGQSVVGELPQPVAVLPGLANPEGRQDCLIPEKLEEGLGAVTMCGSSTNAGNGRMVMQSPLTGEKRIEVCMGGKCRKTGGAALLEEFQRVMGSEGAVAACKCMGKCRDGPNVRILNQEADGLSDSRRTPLNPLCVGVGLQDVEAIVLNFFGEEYSKNQGCVPY